MKYWREYFEAWVQQPLEIRSKGTLFPRIRNELDDLAKNISAILRLCQNDLVLDVGCDSGLVTSRISNYCRRIIAVDFIYGQVKEAIRVDNIQYMVGDGTYLPFVDNVFDKVYCNNMIHDLLSKDDGIQVIKECIRVCKRNGRILIGDVPSQEMRKNLWGFPFKFGKFREEYLLKRISILKLPIIIILSFIPKSLKEGLRKIMKLPDWRVSIGMLTIWYNVNELRKLIESMGMRCSITKQKKSLWCSYARANIVISK